MWLLWNSEIDIDNQVIENIVGSKVMRGLSDRELNFYE